MDETVRRSLTNLETITHLRKLLLGVGIIALTLLKGNAYRPAALAVGADDLVAKAELTTDLLLAIRRAGAGQSIPEGS